MADQRHHRSHRSFFGPILLILVGGLFLANNLGLISAAGWDVIWRLWPILLIAAGLNDLLRGEGIVWPLLLVGLGSFLLVNYFWQGDWVSWSNLVQLWPIILIAVGIDLIFKEQNIWTSLVGVLLMAALLGGGYWLISGGQISNLEDVKISQSITAGQEEAEIHFSLGAGQLRLEDHQRKDLLVEGFVNSPEPDSRLDETESKMKYSLSTAGTGINPAANNWDLTITDHISHHLEVEIGAGELFLFLEDVQVDSLDVDQGVGRMIIRLPEEFGKVVLNQAVGQLIVVLPDDPGLVIKVEKALSIADIPPGFTERGNLIFAPGAELGSDSPDLVVEQAVGQIRFQTAR